VSLHRYGDPTPAEVSGGIDLDTLRRDIAPAASDAELAYFGQVCTHLGLDPWAGQIYFIGRRQKVGENRWQTVHRPQISVAGRRVLAERTGQLEGIQGPEWCAVRRTDREGNKLPLEWDELWDSDEFVPYAARVLVYRSGWKVPANGTAKWSEFAVWEGTGNQRRLSAFWSRAPSHMLGKVAEALALRRAFPEVAAAVAFVDGSGGGREPDDAGVVAEAAEIPPPDAGRQEGDPGRVEGPGPDTEDDPDDLDDGRPF